MSVFRKFDRNDILFSTVHTRPKVSVGLRRNQDGVTWDWFGSTGASGSLSLYGGIRSRYNVKSSDFSSSGIAIYPLDPLDTHSIDKVVFVSGSYPSTGSIRLVTCDNTPYSSFLDVTDTQWYDEHFSPIELLFDHYSKFDSNYFLGSHDFYVLHSNLWYPSSGWGQSVVFSGALSSHPITSTSSFTAEAWIKPTSQVMTNQFIIGQSGLWRVALTSSNGSSADLVLSITSGSTVATTGSNNFDVQPGVWSHVAVAVSGGVSASFYVNGQLKSNLQVPLTIQSGSSTKPLLLVSDVSSSAPVLSPLPSTGLIGGLNGYIFETRLWNSVRTAAEISSSFCSTLIASSSSNLLHYARLNDGAFSSLHGFNHGEGVFDYSANANHGYFLLSSSIGIGFEWERNDHPTFKTRYQIVDTDINRVKLFHIPSMFYGRQIEPGSVKIVDNSRNDWQPGSGITFYSGIKKVYIDDGKGTLFLSGSVSRQISNEDYTGNTRCKVGNVFYSEGLIVFTDKTIVQTFVDKESTRAQVFDADVLPAFTLEFRGNARIHTKTFNCRLSTAQANASNNPTFSYLDDNGTEATDDDRMVVERVDGITYITAVGLYNEDRQLVAVAKLAQPIRKREKDKINIRLKMDF